MEEDRKRFAVIYDEENTLSKVRECDSLNEAKQDADMLLSVGATNVSIYTRSYRAYLKAEFDDLTDDSTTFKRVEV